MREEGGKVNQAAAGIEWSQLAINPHRLKIVKFERAY
jgi:hypothetical protein